MDAGFSALLRNVLPGGLIALSVLAGLLLQRLVSVRLRRTARRTQAGWADVLVRSLHGVVFIWSVLAGLAVTLRIAPLGATLFFFLQKGVILTAILSATVFLSRAVSGLTELYITRVAGIPSTIFRNLAVMVAGTVGTLVLLDELGVSIAPILTALGVGGLAFALALQDTLSNLFAGLHILMSKNVRVNDYIKLASGEEGTVTDITWRNTTLRALENNLVIVPNKRLAESILVNYTLPDAEVMVLVDVKLGYGTDLRKAEALLVEEGRRALGQAPGGVASYEPLVRFNTLGDFNVRATVVLRAVEFAQQYRLRHEFIKNVGERFAAEGLERPFPVGRVVVEKNP